MSIEEIKERLLAAIETQKIQLSELDRLSDDELEECLDRAIRDFLGRHIRVDSLSNEHTVEIMDLWICRIRAHLNRSFHEGR